MIDFHTLRRNQLSDPLEYKPKKKMDHEDTPSHHQPCPLTKEEKLQDVKETLHHIDAIRDNHYRLTIVNIILTDPNSPP